MGFCRMRLYHGTDFVGSKDLKVNKEKAIKPDTYTTKQIKNHDIKGKEPGSLGYGFYTFLDDPKIAYKFANKFLSDEKYNHTVVFELEADVLSDNLLVLDGISEDSKRLNQWLHGSKVKKIVDYLAKKYSNQGPQKSLDGAMIELYCLTLKEKHLAKIKAVQAPTHTYIKDDVLHESSILNGVEVLIKDPSIVKTGSFNIYKCPESDLKF